MGPLKSEDGSAHCAGQENDGKPSQGETQGMSRFDTDFLEEIDAHAFSYPKPAQ